MNLCFLILAPAKIIAGNISSQYNILDVSTIYYNLSLGAHLFPFTIHFESIGLDHIREVKVSADLFLGFVFMIAGFLFVISNTRNHMDGIYTTIPFLCYSYTLLGLVTWLISQDLSTTYTIKPYSTAILATVFILSAGVAATLIARRWLKQTQNHSQSNDLIDIELH